MKTKTKMVMLGLVFLFIICTATSVRAKEYYGATQGFWKNHTELWTDTPYNINTLVMDVFDNSHLVWYMITYRWTFLDVLTIPFGYCSEHILMRQAVAALLNAQAFGNGYPLIATQISDMVNAAMNSGGVYGVRDVKLELADQLESYNKAGLPKGWP